MDADKFGRQSYLTRSEWFLLLSMVIIGFWLRMHDLASLSFYADEETRALAVQGILNDGYPHMPSGMYYLV